MTDDFDPWADPPAAAELTPATIPAPPAAESGLFQAPRLGIMHFVAWTAVAAVLFKLDVAMQQVPDASKPETGVVGRALVLSCQILNAAQIVALMVILRGGVLRHMRRLQPGHWLVLISTSLTVLPLGVCYILVLIASTMDSESRETVFRFFGDIYTGSALVGCIGCFVAAQLTRTQQPWPWLLRIAALLLFAAAVTTMAISVPLALAVEGVSAVLRLLVWLIATAADLRYRQRDWVHWLGLLTVSHRAAMEVAWLVMFYIDFGDKLR